jgi:acyl-CoA dehydrogenase
MFEQTIAKLLDGEITPLVRQSAAAGVWPAGLWAAIEENGIGVAASPERHGGVGASWNDAFVLLDAAGRYGAPIPLVETIAANWLLGRVGLDVVAGPATLAVSADGELEHGVFSGTLHDVPWGTDSPHVVTTVGRELVLLATGDSRGRRGTNIAREPRDTLLFSSARPVARGPLLPGMPDGLIQSTGAMIRAAQIAGALRHLVETVVEYANLRVQFGRPIGTFQAVQHQVAILAEQAAIAASAAEAAVALASGPSSLLPIAVAKSVASEAAGHGAAIAHAIHGAIGFTEEHSLHFLTQRLWSWRSEFGSQRFWAGRIGDAVCARGSQTFWDDFISNKFLR